MLSPNPTRVGRHSGEIFKRSAPECAAAPRESKPCRVLGLCFSPFPSSVFPRFSPRFLPNGAVLARTVTRGEVNLGGAMRPWSSYQLDGKYPWYPGIAFLRAWYS